MYKTLKGKNGLTVTVSKMPSMASVALSIWVGVGGRYESKQSSGISHLVEHMLFKGTNTRSTKDLKESIEGVGGAFNGFTSDEVTCYMVKVPAKYLELGMDVLMDMVMDPRFDKDDLKREKFVVCEEIKMYQDQPSDRVLDELGSLMWPGNALGRPLTGTMTTVKSITKEDLVKFKEANYQPSNIAIVAAGKADPKKVFDYAMKKFSKYPKKKKPTFKSAKASQKKPCVKICRGNTNQAHIAFGFHSTGKNYSERFAIKMMNVILGGNMSSRLFEELREKNGLCYDISSAYKRHSDTGEIQIHAGVDNRKATKSIIAILDELKKLKDTGVTSDELCRAKEYAKGQFLLAMERTSSRMMWLGDQIMVHNEIPEVNNVLKRIDAVTLNSIDKILNKVFTSSGLNMAMIGKLTDKEKSLIKREIGKL